VGTINILPFTFDKIVFYIIPLLKNGTTPENQTILTVLEDLAVRIQGDKWMLKPDRQSQWKIF